jgi:hypothetical protein
MINKLIFWFKFKVRVSQEALNQAPCKNVKSWVLISERETDDCQGNWYERLFYSRQTKQLLYGLSDRYIFHTKEQGQKLPVVELVPMNPDYVAKMSIEDMQKITDKIKKDLF